MIGYVKGFSFQFEIGYIILAYLVIAFISFVVFCFGFGCVVGFQYINM